MIPVGNLYYLLCYAWNKLDESELIDVNALPRQDLPNLLGRILVGGVTRLLRQGVDRAYIESSEITHGPKGKIDLAFTVKTGSLDRNAVRCQIDALDQNILHNQIIKTILHRLTAAQEVDASLRSSMRVLAQHLNSVSAIGLRNQDFKRVQLHRNNSFYRFLLNVCDCVTFAYYPINARDSTGLEIS
jgi:5-methylcytosine-specific restriction enzyme subunit McrC